MSKR
ncbi:hypothetical protein COCON_G00139950 [Conger conger]|jgi:hypothetical protein